MARSSTGHTPSLPRGSTPAPRDQLRTLLHELGNDLGALRLRVSIMGKAPPSELDDHLSVAGRLASHSEELVRQLRQALDLDGRASISSAPARAAGSARPRSRR